MSEGGELPGQVVRFCRALRRAGVPVGPASVIDALRAVEVIGIDRRHDFYWALHAILVTRRDQHAVFDEVFRLFWRAPERERIPIPDGPASDRRQRPKAAQRRAAEAVLETTSSGRPPPPEIELDARMSASAREALKSRDFAQMSAAEIAEAERQIDRLILPDDRIRTRRMQPSAPPGRIDARQTLRASLRTGGDIILLRHRRRVRRRPPIVVLCDISGSMSTYSRVLLHFFHALGRQRRVTTFLFGTRLTNVTRQLRYRDIDEALAATASAVADWSGGTRIGAAIDLFNRLWSRRVLGQGAIVLLITDGLERDGIEGLAEAMDRLHRSTRRLIWLNPLLGYENFEAKASGIRAMLPHVDEVRTIHSLESVTELCAALAGEGGAAGDPRRWLAAA
ncbi:MAG: VWA domain-containing protein [Bauldia sp.]|nr:VWA domain-containing protein [Bauldia sp.]